MSSKALTTPRGLAVNEEKIQQFCSFWLAGRLYGVNILDVREVNRELDFTSIFHADSWMKGYLNIRGQIHLVVDLRIVLGYPPQATNSESRVVIFKNTVGESFGALVDKVGEIVAVSPEQVEARISNEENRGLDERNRGLIAGECKLDGRLMVLLNPSKFLTAT